MFHFSTGRKLSQGKRIRRQKMLFHGAEQEKMTTLSGSEQIRKA